MEAKKRSKLSELKEKFIDKVLQVRNLGLSDLSDNGGMGGIFVRDEQTEAPKVRTPGSKK